MHYYDEPAAGPGRAGPGDQERELLIASIDELSPEDRRHVAALVESLRNRPAPPAGGWAPPPTRTSSRYSAAATNHARPDLLFGHHRTVRAPTRRGVSS